MKNKYLKIECIPTPITLHAYFCGDPKGLVKKHAIKGKFETDYCDGITCPADTNNIIVWMRVGDPFATIHECVHVTQIIANLTGIHDEEFFAYMIQWLSTTLCAFIDKHGLIDIYYDGDSE